MQRERFRPLENMLKSSIFKNKIYKLIIQIEVLFPHPERFHAQKVCFHIQKVCFYLKWKERTKNIFRRCTEKGYEKLDMSKQRMPASKTWPADGER